MAHTYSGRSPPIVIPPHVPSPRGPATLVFIHGYNFFASQFDCIPPNHLSVAHHIHKSPALQHIKIIIPEALPSVWPSIPKNVWYNIGTPIPSPGDPSKVSEEIEAGPPGRNEDDMKVSMDYFESIIKSEVENGTPANRIVFMGDSQGASILGLFILTRKMAAELGAVITYAGFPCTSQSSAFRMIQENGLSDHWSKGTQLFMLHGKGDVFVSLAHFHQWGSLLEEFRDRGQGISSIKCKVIDGMRHSLTDVLWPHVRQILVDVVPNAEQRSSPLKL